MLQELVLKHIGHRLSQPLTFKWLLDVLHGHATEPAQVFLHLHTYTCMHTRTYTHANTHILVVYIGDIGDIQYLLVLGLSCHLQVNMTDNDSSKIVVCLSCLSWQQDSTQQGPEICRVMEKHTNVLQHQYKSPNREGDGKVDKTLA